MKRIGVLLTSLAGAGTERTILTLCEGLLRYNCDVTLFAIRDRVEYMPPAGIKYVCLNADTNALARQRVKSTLSPIKDEFDFFIVSSTKFFDYVPIENKVGTVHITPTAWIKSECFDWYHRPRKLARLRRKFRGKRMVALSNGIKDDLVSSLGCKEEDITVIPNPFDLEKMRQLAEAEDYSSEMPYIICVASLTARKRHDDLITSFALMQDQKHDLLLVGKGPEKERLQALAESLGVGHRVKFYGWTSNPYPLMKNAALSVLTSEAEGSPRVVIESLLLGTPVVSTDCPSGPSEILTGKFSDYLVSIGDCDAIATAMDAAVQAYPQDFSTLELDRFISTEVAKRYLELFSDGAS